MILNYTVGEDLKKGNVIGLGPDGKMYKSTKPFGKVMLVEKIHVNVGR